VRDLAGGRQREQAEQPEDGRGQRPLPQFLAGQRSRPGPALAWRPRRPGRSAGRRLARGRGLAWRCLARGRCLARRGPVARGRFLALRRCLAPGSLALRRCLAPGSLALRRRLVLCSLTLGCLTRWRLALRPAAGPRPGSGPVRRRGTGTWRWRRDRGLVREEQPRRHAATRLRAGLGAGRRSGRRLIGGQRESSLGQRAGELTQHYFIPVRRFLANQGLLLLSIIPQPGGARDCGASCRPGPVR
jgi:hypothetical protein